jgi:hypothetical protein
MFQSTLFLGREGGNKNWNLIVSYISSRLGGVLVSVLATGPKGCGFETGQGDGFLRAIKNPQHTTFRMGCKVGGPMS